MISVLIIGYNNNFYLKKCIESLIFQTAEARQIIYFDNNSTDNSVEFIKDKYPNVKIIKSETNLGYAKAANIGIDVIRDDYVLIMNPDMILDREYLKNCLAAINNNKKNAGVTGKIYKYNFELSQRTKIIDTVGLVASRSRQFLDYGAGNHDVGQYEKPMEIFGISGNCALFRKAALLDAKIGKEYFDEEFFMYKEDVDLCWRLRLLGWKFIYTPNAIAYHNRGTGILSRITLRGSISGRKQLNNIQRYYSFKNHRLTLIKNELKTTFLRDIFYIMSREIAIILWVVFMESNRYRLFHALLKQLPIIYRKRKNIMKRKRISDYEIGSWFKDGQRSNKI